MGRRCVLKVDDLLPVGPLEISHVQFDDISITYASMKGWQSAGEYYSTTVEFDFNMWGSTYQWLEPWLMEHRVPYKIV